MLAPHKKEMEPAMQHERLFLSPPHMSGKELAFIEEAFASNYVAPLGPMVDAFEKEFSAFTEIPYVVALSSGTAALHLALRGLGIGPGDTVITPTLTFIAGVSPIVYLGATPIFLDVSPQTWALDVNLLEEELKNSAQKGKLPKAVIPTDLYGQSCDIEAIKQLCAPYGIPVIVDSAESAGATYKGHSVGYHADAAIFSFNGNKIITTAGGGMLASHNKKIIDEARFLSQQARDPAPYYQHTTIGYNYRLSNILAAIGRAQLGVLRQRVERKREIADYYKQNLQHLPGVSFMPEAPYGRSNWWLTPILINEHEFGTSCEQVRLNLEVLNIESRRTWKPMHLQPIFSDIRCVGGKVSEEIFNKGLCLPSGTQMSASDMDRVIGAIYESCSN
jgi:dTDP-4-amino-4,6-dideoxygalactose transaminase